MTRHDQGTEASPDPWQGVNRFHVESDPDRPGFVYHVEAGPNQPAGFYMWADHVDRARAAVEAAHQQEIARLTQERDKYRNGFTSSQEQIGSLLAERDALAAQIADLHTNADLSRIALDQAEAQIAGLREALRSIETLLSSEIAARFGGHPSKSEAEMGRKSAVYALLVVPRNMARAALAATEPGGTDGD